jgi:hypothetical protein
MRQSDVQKQFREISIAADGKVKIKFIERVFEAAQGDAEESEDIVREFAVKSSHKPHKDLLDTMQKLRKIALASVEMDYDTKKISHYAITKVKMTGNFHLRQSRVVMTVTKKIEWSEGTTDWETPEITMYGESKFEEVEKMTAILEDLVEEIWSYANGKYGAEGQLPLFGRAHDQVIPKLVTNFHQ